MSLAHVRWIDVPHTTEDRGTLTALERPLLPFDGKRIFYMHQVPAGYERGAHAHRRTQQCVLAVTGGVTLDLSDGTTDATYVLDDPHRALYMPAMMWVRLWDFRPGTVALVLCDTVYNPAHVVRAWDEYRRLLREEPPAE